MRLLALVRSVRRILRSLADYESVMMSVDLSPAFLVEAVGRLDLVFGKYRYQDVTAAKPLGIEATVNPSEIVVTRTGFEPVLPP